MSAGLYFGAGKGRGAVSQILKPRVGLLTTGAASKSSQNIPLESSPPREKLRASFGCSRKVRAAGGIHPFGTCGESETVKKREADVPTTGGKETAAERKKRKICGPFVEKAEKRDERTGKRKIKSFATPEAVFAAMKDPEKDIDPDTETGAQSRKNILAWLRVYSDDAAEKTKKANDAALFKA